MRTTKPGEDDQAELDREDAEPRLHNLVCAIQAERDLEDEVRRLTKELSRAKRLLREAALRKRIMANAELRRKGLRQH